MLMQGVNLYIMYCNEGDITRWSGDQIAGKCKKLGFTTLLRKRAAQQVEK